MTNEQVSVLCERCVKQIPENKANAYYQNNNYLIVCDECYKNLEQQNDR